MSIGPLCLAEISLKKFILSCNTAVLLLQIVNPGKKLQILFSLCLYQTGLWDLIKGRSSEILLK